MNTTPESPRYILILGSLFLLAYVAYNLGLALVDSVPQNSAVLETATLTLTPTVTQTPSITPTSRPLIWVTPTYLPPDMGGNLEVIATPTPTIPETVITSTATPVADDPTSITIPTSTPITDDAYPAPIETATATLTVPTATSGAYPGPSKTEGPYPGPDDTPNPSVTQDPEDVKTPLPTSTATEMDEKPTFTPTPLTPGQNTPTPVLPTPTSVAIINTLPYSETRVISHSSVNQAIWSRDGNSLALSTSTGLYIYDAETLTIQMILDAGTSVVSAGYAFNDEILVTGGSDGIIRCWEMETQRYLGSLSGHLLGVVHLDLPSFGNFMASGSDDATVRTWDISRLYNLGVDSVQLLNTFRDPITRVADMDTSPNGDMVAAASQQHIHVWHPQTGVLQKKIYQSDGWYTAVAFSPNSQTLVSAFDGRKLEFWDTFTWERTQFIPLSAPVKALAYSSDGFYLAIGYEDGRIEIWDLRARLLRVELDGHPDLSSLAFDPIDDRFVTSSKDGTIRVWNIATLYGRE